MRTTQLQVQEPLRCDGGPQRVNFGFPAGCLRAGDFSRLRGPGGNTTGAPVDAEAGGEQVPVSLVCLFVLGFSF